MLVNINRVQEMPSMGALLGSVGSSRLLDDINNSFSGTSFFGTIRDAYRDIRGKFIQNVIAPIQAADRMIMQTITTMVNPDVIRPITNEDQLQAVPPCMHAAILMHAPIRRLLEQGRISGWGYEADALPDEDVYGRLINNGYVPDALAAADDEGVVICESTWYSDDPDLSDDELTSIQKTRDFIDMFMAQSRKDPTDLSSERG